MKKVCVVTGGGSGIGFAAAKEAAKKTPVVRSGKQSTLGYQPDIWKGWNLRE